MKKQHNQNCLSKQHGAAVLLVSIVLLIGVTLITVFAARVGVMDQRISANEKRHTEAYTAAEAGLDETLSFVRYALGSGTDLYDTSNLEACDGTEVFSNGKTYPCNAGSTFTHVYDPDGGTTDIERLSAVADLDVGSFSSYVFYNDGQITVVSQGNSEDGTGSSTIQNSIGKISILTTGPIPPIMAPASSLSGNFTVVPNPNLKVSGSGVPISAWVATFEVTGGGSFASCHAGDYLHGTSGNDVCVDLADEDDWASKTCNCEPDKILSDKDNQNYDIVIEGSGNLPDPYEYVFGLIPKSTLKETSYQIDDCDDGTLAGVQSLLDSGGLRENYGNRVWVKGDCQMSSGSSIPRLGSKDNPIVLIADGATRINGTKRHIWGIVFSFGDIDIQGTPTVHGSLVADDGQEIGGNGTYDQVYDEDVFNSLFSEDLNSTTARVAYQYCDTCN
jgi:Tfp pilus assembly protein PilX